MKGAAFLAVAAPSLLWYSPLLRGRTLLAAMTPLCDQWHINVPFAFLLGEALHAGRLPVWTERLGGGYPLLAVGEAGVLYPPHLLLYRLFPPLLSYHLNVILAALLAHAFTYLFCRTLGCSRMASWLGGLAYTFGGFFVVHVSTLHSAQAAAWIPALFLALRLAVADSRLWRWALVGAVLGVQVTIGYPQVTYYGVFAATAWGFFEGWGARWRRLREPGTRSSSCASGRVGLLHGALLALVTAGGLSAAHWLPNLELTRQSTRRGPLPYETATLFTWPPVNLLTFIAPYAFGNPARGENQGWAKTGHFWDNGYVGLVPLWFALWTGVARFRRERHVRFLVLMALLALVTAMGPHTPLYRVLWYAMPGFALFRFPSRCLVLTTLALAVLAALGADRLLEKGPQRLRWAAWGVVLAAATLDLAFFAARFHRF
ncbi:MAG: hypothetical protein QHJ73_00810, partial [Armatimonadota bacterium]|nr:hypothetical protein [Armatimonadota bacterium]